MKFGVFDYIEGSEAPLHKTYEERIELIKALEAAAFYGYHLSEHHATPLSMTPSPSIFLAAAARETRRIRLGTLLYLLPLYHPLRLLEELCMLDHLSGGRLDIGVGRGISPHEFEAFGEDFEQSGNAFEHCFNVLYQGFTRDRIDYSCDRLHAQGHSRCHQAAAASVPAVLVRAARGPRSAVRRATWHERRHAWPRRPDRRHPAGVPWPLGDARRGAQAAELSGADAARRRHAGHVRRR